MTNAAAANGQPTAEAVAAAPDTVAAPAKLSIPVNGTAMPPLANGNAAAPPPTDPGSAASPQIQLPAEALENGAAAEVKAEEDAAIAAANEIRAVRATLALAYSKPAEEPERPCASWGFLLKEMAWMARDFAQVGVA